MTVFWDWNGTLIADVPLVVRMNNLVFAKYGYPPTDEEAYRRLFCFPVREYYRALGVTDEHFRSLAPEWNALYVEHFAEASLTDGAVETVRRFHQAGFRQVIISASQQDQLRAQVARFPELDGMFEEILGLGDVYAVSKVQLAKDYLSRSGVRAEEAVFLGDTCHDAEVARAIGCRCMLLSGGHQCDAVLAEAGVPVIGALTQAADRLGA